MAKTVIEGILEEQESHAHKQPPLKGKLRVEGKNYNVAGWIYYRPDGSIAVSIASTGDSKPGEF